MKKFFTKISLMAVALLMGGVSSAWAETQDVEIMNYDFNSGTNNQVFSEWTLLNGKGGYQHTAKYKTAAPGYLEVWSNVNASRNGYWDFGVTSALTADNWTLTFKLAMNASVPDFAVTGTNTTYPNNTTDAVSNNAYLLLSRTATNTYTAKVGTTVKSTTLTLTEGTLYDYTIAVSSINDAAQTAVVDVTIKNGSTDVASYQVTGAEGYGIGKLRGFHVKDNTNALSKIDDLLLIKTIEGAYVEMPTSTVIGANGNNRTVTLSSATEGANIKWSETAPAEGEDFSSWTAYNGTSLTTSSSTIYAVAIKDATNSDVNTISTGAGTTLTLNKASVSCTAFTNAGSAITGVQLKVTAPDNSSVIGNPASTMTYTFTPDGGEESSPVSIANNGTYTPTGKGVLNVYSAAAGYNTSVYTIPVSNIYIPSYVGRDYTTATTSDFGTWNAASTPTWEGWATGLTEHLLNAALSDDYHLNIQNASTIRLIDGWGLTRTDNTYGYRSRYTVPGDFFALKVNTSKGTDNNAIAYRTVYSTSGTGVNTNVITITAQKADLVQQLIQYSPASGFTKTVGTTGFGTFSATVPVTVPAGVTVYETSQSGSTVEATATEATIIPANTAVVFKASASSSVTFSVASEAGTAITSCLTAAPAGKAGDGTFCGLQKDAMRFAKVMTGVSLAANSAYLPISVSGKEIKFVVVDDVTAATAVTEQAAKVAPVKYINAKGQIVIGNYNVAGQMIK